MVIFALLLASIPTLVAHSQMGGGYICGQFQRLDAGTRGFPAFVPFGSENNPSDWWIIGTLNQMIPVISTGEEIPPDYGQYLRIWVPDFDSYSDSNQYLISINSYEYVDSCDPVIQFYADNETLFSGECTVIHWSADASGLDSADLNGNAVNPGVGDLQVCPSQSTSYTLRVNTSGGDFSQILSINVIQPTSTPIPLPTRTPIPPTSTRIPSSVTPVPPTPLPTAHPYEGALPGDGYEPSPSWLEQIMQIFAPPVEANSPADCQARFTVNNCTWFVASKRPDVCQWIQPGQGNAFQWASQAQKNGGSLGITVETTPKAGDIAVWSQDCGGTPKGQCSESDWACGHVAYVTWASSDGKTMKIQEMNWSVDRTDIPIDVLSCMSFIGSPSHIITSNVAITPTVIPTPIPGLVPTPSGQPSNFFQWIIDIFNP